MVALPSASDVEAHHHKICSKKTTQGLLDSVSVTRKIRSLNKTFKSDTYIRDSGLVTRVVVYVMSTIVVEPVW